jgi:hypothetical protein
MKSVNNVCSRDPSLCIHGDTPTTDGQQHHYEDDCCTSEQLWMQPVAPPAVTGLTVSAPAVTAFSTVKTEPVPAVTPAAAAAAATSRNSSGGGGMQLGVKRGSMTLDDYSSSSLGGSALSRPRKRLRNLVAPVLTKEREVCDSSSSAATFVRISSRYCLVSFQCFYHRHAYMVCS